MTKNNEELKNFFKTIPVKSMTRAFFILFVGSTIVALALHIFYLPTGLIIGGVSGISTLIYSIVDVPIPFGLSTILLNVPIFIAGAYFVSKKFFALSLIGTLAYGFFIDIWEPVFAPLHRYFFVNPSDVDNLILCSIGGGALYGIGLGLVFYAGFTTGGTDMIAIIVRRFSRRFSVGQVVWILDASIIIVSAIVYQFREPGQFKLGLYSSIAMICTSACIDFILEGFNYKRVAYIISAKSDEIAERIMTDMKRGVTSLYGKGMYSKKDIDVLTCVVKQEQVLMIKTIAEEIDPKAFVFVIDAREVVGEGFHGGSDF